MTTDRKLYLGSPVISGRREQVGFEQITSLSSAASLTPPATARLALIQAEGENVRWRDDGTDPTASVGMVIEVGGVLHYTGKFDEFRAIEELASAKLNVTYYR